MRGTNKAKEMKRRAGQRRATYKGSLGWRPWLSTNSVWPLGRH
jgi:hypothetical protein